MKLQYIVTGTGRSGTVYMAKLLTSLGLPCGHEGVFNRFGSENARELLEHPERIRTSLVSGSAWLPPGGKVVADSSYMAAPYLGEPLLHGTDVIHAVRHPLHVVSSFVKDLFYFVGTKVSSSYETFIYGKIPELYQEMSPVERACIFYVRWNEMIEKARLAGGSCYFRYRVEDTIDGLLEFLGLEDVPGPLFHDRKANTMRKGKKPFFLKDIPDGPAKEAFVGMGRRYGYDMDLKLKLF